MGKKGITEIQGLSESAPKPSSSATDPASMRAGDPTIIGPESSLGATEQLEPEATEDEPVEVAPRGSNPLLTPLTSEQEQHLTLAAKALDRLQLGFEDCHLHIVRGLRAARRAAWKAAWDAGDTQQIRENRDLAAFLNTYRTMCRFPEPHFRHVLEELRGLALAA